MKTTLRILAIAAVLIALTLIFGMGCKKEGNDSPVQATLTVWTRDTGQWSIVVDGRYHGIQPCYSEVLPDICGSIHCSLTIDTGAHVVRGFGFNGANGGKDIAFYVGPGDCALIEIPQY